MRGQKGITLVALIITIVVLLILAVVAITAITDTGLVEKSNTAAQTYNNSVANEGTQLQNYANAIDNYMGIYHPQA